MRRGFDTDGKVALVTGGARGIGYETARQLHERGASVTIVDLDPERSRAAAERIGERTLGIGADVTDRGAIERAAAETVQRFGGIDVAFANAGIVQAEVATIHSIDPAEWERVFEVDMLGMWRTVRAVLPQVVARQGHIVLNASTSAFFNGVLNSPYAVAKAGVEALGRTLRVELRPFGATAGVTFFGFVDTRLTEAADARPYGERLKASMPGFMRKTTPTDEAASAVVKAIEKRAARTFLPRWGRRSYLLRGLVEPIVDRGMERSGKLGEILREIEADADRGNVAEDPAG